MPKTMKAIAPILPDLLRVALEAWERRELWAFDVALLSLRPTNVPSGIYARIRQAKADRQRYERAVRQNDARSDRDAGGWQVVVPPVADLLREAITMAENGPR